MKKKDFVSNSSMGHVSGRKINMPSNIGLDQSSTYGNGDRKGTWRWEMYRCILIMLNVCVHQYRRTKDVRFW